MLSGSFQNLLNMGGMPSGLNNAVAEVDREKFATPAQRMQREAELQKLEFDTLKGRQEGKDNLIQGIGTSLVSNQMIPGMAIGNMQGLVVQGQGQGQGNQTFSIGKQQIPAVTLDGGKTYFDPRDGSPIDMNSLQPKDFFTDFGQGIKAIKEAKEQGGTYMNEETRKMMEMLEDF